MSQRSSIDATEPMGPTRRLPTTLAEQPPANAVEQLREAIRGSLPEISERGAEIEAARRLPQDLVEDLRSWGVFRLWMPAELGGLEAPPDVVLDVVEQLAWADGSVGWCAMVGLGTNALAAIVPESGARGMFITGREIAGGVFMPRGQLVPVGRGAFRVSGTWPFASGAEHCDWICAGAHLHDHDPNGQPDTRLVFVPAADVEILDTWDVAGLQGTGSHDFRIREAIVPANRVGTLACPDPWPRGVLWRIPVTTLLLPLLAGVSLGIARRAIDDLTTLATKKVPHGSSRRLCERELAQAAVARGHAMVQAARGYLYEAMDAVYRAAVLGDAADQAQRAEARLAGVHAAQSAAEVAGLCYRTGGGTALYRSSPLQRAFRDANAATQHYALSHTGYESLGRVLLGLSPDGPI